MANSLLISKRDEFKLKNRILQRNRINYENLNKIKNSFIFS